MEPKLETGFSLKEKISRATKAKYDHDERFYTTTVIEGSCLSVAADGRLCWAD